MRTRKISRNVLETIRWHGYCIVTIYGTKVTQLYVRYICTKCMNARECMYMSTHVSTK